MGEGREWIWGRDGGDGDGKKGRRKDRVGNGWMGWDMGKRNKFLVLDNLLRMMYEDDV